MVINYFNILCTNIRPTKADTPLIVDANAVLTQTITLECFKVIAERHPQIIESTGDFELSEFATRDLGDIREPPDTLTF